MSRVDQFYKKYSMETPEEKKEREELELKAKKKEARKARKAVKQQVAKEIGDFTGITKDQEGVIIQKITDERNADRTPYERLDEVIKEKGLAVSGKYIACEEDVLLLIERNAYRRGHEAANEELTKLNTEKDEEEMNAEQMKVIVAEVVTAMNENRNKELALQIKLQEAQNDALRMQLELAHLAMDKHLASMEGKVEEVEAKTQVEEQFEEKPKRGRRKGSVNKKNKVEEVVTEPNLIPAQYIRESGRINWKAIQDDNLFLTVVASIVGDAAERGVDVTRGDVFRKSSKVAGAAYQRFMDENKGIRGAWKAFLMELGVQVG